MVASFVWQGQSGPLGSLIRASLVSALIVHAGVNRAAEKPAPLPAGLDAYRSWDRWAEQRIGMRAYMRSTYDRTGGNEGADASHFLYQLSDDFKVPLDIEAPDCWFQPV